MNSILRNEKLGVLVEAPTDYTIVSQFPHKPFVWNASRIQLFVSPAQESKCGVKGYDLREELKGRPLLNASVLDFLLGNQSLIPDEWKRQQIFFWGTIYGYHGSSRVLSVRCLYWNELDRFGHHSNDVRLHRWRWGNGLLHDYWGSDRKTAMLS